MIGSNQMTTPLTSFFVPFLIFFLFLLEGCNFEKEASKNFSVGLLTPGSVNDGGWNQGAFEGLQNIETVLNARTSHVETRSPAEFEEAFRGYAADGYDLVFGHGFEYQEAAARAGKDFPETIFITTSGNTVLKNVAPMVFRLEEATFLCGLLGARLSTTGMIGMVGGIDLPSIRSTFDAFAHGAKTGRPDIETREVFIGNFDDSAAAKEAARALLSAGADFLIHQANDAGRGVFDALADRDETDPIYACGTNRDQSLLSPSVVIASATLDIPTAFLKLAREVLSGNFVAEPLLLGMSDGVVDFVWNNNLAANIESEIKFDLEVAKEKIRSGHISISNVKALGD